MALSNSTSTSAKYKTNGSYNTGGAETNGCPSNFAIYMHSSSQNGSTGTISNDKVLNWSYVYIKIEVSQLSNHQSFKLTRNGITYSSKTLSGNSNLTLYSGSLSDGNYELTYVGNYKKNIFTGTTTFTYKYRFVIDKTGPTYSLKAGGVTVSSGTYTNKQIVYSVSDYKTYCIYYRKPSSSSYSTTYSDSYTIAATDSNNGRWYLYAEDWYYNTNTTVNVYLDTIKPVGTVRAGGYIVSNGGYTNKAISYTATDTGGINYLQYKSPSSSSWVIYSSGTSVSGSNGWYTFRAVDLAGNYSDEYKVYYDASIPTGTLYGGASTKSSGSYTNAEYVKYVASNSYSGIANCYVKLPNASYYSSYTSGSQLTAEGTYEFYCVSKAGTSSATVKITLDKTKPVGTLYGGGSVVANNGYTNADYIKFMATDRTAITAYVKKPGSSSFVTYTLGTQFTEEGTYEFKAVDQANNTSDIYTITLSREIPSAQLYVDGNPFGNNGYTNGGHIKFECDETCYVMLPGTSTYISYASGTEFYKPGKYVFYGISPANNHSGYFSIVIDRTEKPLVLSNVTNGVTKGNVSIDWTDKDATIYAPVVKVTINGKPYDRGEQIYTVDGGVYRVFCEDAAGNTWETEFVSSKRNVLTETLQKEYFEAPDKDGNIFAFMSYDNAFAFAAEREMGFVRTGIWNNESWDTGIPMDAKDSVNAVNGTYFIYKKSGNASEEVAYFTEERLNEVIAEYAKIGIVDYFYWEKTPAPVYEGNNLFGYSDERSVLANSVSLDGTVRYRLNGEDFIGTVIETEGVHVLTAYDDWGNTCDYTLTVIRCVPEIHYALGEGGGNLVTFDREYYLKDKVTVSIADEYDEFAMYCIYDENGELLAEKSIGETYEFDLEGKYTVRAVNHFGESQEFVLYLSLDAPKAELTQNTEDKKLEITIVESSDRYSNLETLEIYKSTDGGETWMAVAMDDYGNVVSLERLTYYFRTSGIYKVVLTDEFRTGIDAVTEMLDYQQMIPQGVLTGVEDGGYTNTQVTFTWYDEAIVTVYKDGELMEYVSGQVLEADGRYEITFENFDGFSKLYTFVIDTVSPELNLEGAENGCRVNTDVAVEWEEDELTIELYKDGVRIADFINGGTLTEDGEYRAVLTDFAHNTTEVTFVIDKTADFEIDICDKGLANSVIVTANEELTASLTKDGNEVAYSFGDSIAVPGQYVLRVEDQLGNSAELAFTIVEPKTQRFEHNFDEMSGFEKVLVNGEEKRLNYGTLELNEDGIYEVGVVVSGKTYCFSIMVDATAPEVVLNGAENGGTTNRDVSAEWTETDVSATLMFGWETKPYQSGDILTAEGTYELVLIDDVGNKTVLTFVIDKTVEYTVNTVDGFISNEDVVFNADEELTIRLTKDGNEMLYAFGYPISEEGDYVAVLTDQYGNTEEVAFWILKKTLQRSFDYDFGDTEITSVTLNGESCELDFEADGTYVVTSGEYSFTITLDRIAPTLELNGVGNEGSTKKSVTLENLSEQATVQVYLNDELIEYEIGSKLSETGKYRVVVTDEVGNVSEYSFEILSRVNGVLIAVLVIGVLAVIGVGVFLFLKKKKRD